MPKPADDLAPSTGGTSAPRHSENVQQNCRQYFDSSAGLLTPRRHGPDHPPATAGGGRRGRGAILAFGAGEREVAIGQRLAVLAVFARTRPEILAALRASRQAARSGARGYDPVRHAALCRLAKAGHP